jgi:hypothetical protein
MRGISHGKCMTRVSYKVRSDGRRLGTTFHAKTYDTLSCPTADVYDKIGLKSRSYLGAQRIGLYDTLV